MNLLAVLLQALASKAGAAVAASALAVGSVAAVQQITPVEPDVAPATANAEPSGEGEAEPDENGTGENGDVAEDDPGSAG